MGLLNYTTEVAVNKTLGEITSLLVQAGAQAIMQEFDGCGNVTSLRFKIKTQFGPMGFTLPADVRATANVLNQQVKDRKIPRRFHNDLDQARRVAWRIMKQWLEAQLALIETGQASIQQIFLAYMHTPTGETLYERLTANKFDTLLIPENIDNDTSPNS